MPPVYSAHVDRNNAKAGTAVKAGTAHEAFLASIRDAGRPISGTDLHKAIRAAGQPESTWTKWRSSLGDWIVLHPRVGVVGSGGAKRYQWTEPITAQTALERLTQRVKAPEWLREAWSEAVADGLSAAGGVNPALRAAQERQAKINVVRGVAELAIEVEEIAHNGADSEQIVKRVRNAAALRDLTPIGVAGEDTVFDPAVHKLQFGEPKPGIPVFVLKPGYIWRYGDEVVVVERALVATV
jgi:hypothetical protein